LRLAKEAARIPLDAPVKLTVFPAEKDPFETIYERLFGKEGEDDGTSSRSIQRSLKTLEPLLLSLEALRDGGPGVLVMPAIGPVR
jgi:hypothetical protein